MGVCACTCRCELRRVGFPLRPRSHAARDVVVKIRGPCHCCHSGTIRRSGGCNPKGQLRSFGFLHRVSVVSLQLLAQFTLAIVNVRVSVNATSGGVLLRPSALALLPCLHARNSSCHTWSHCRSLCNQQRRKINVVAASLASAVAQVKFGEHIRDGTKMQPRST